LMCHCIHGKYHKVGFRRAVVNKGDIHTDTQTHTGKKVIT
jgi:hypothetical protein